MLVHPEESKVQGDASKYQVVGASLNNKLPHIVESSVARVNKYMGSKSCCYVAY